MDKYIGLDLGTTTCGIVYSDSLGIVHNKENFRFEPGNYKACRERVIYWVNELGIKNIVIGFHYDLIVEKEKDANLFVDLLKIC